MNDTELREQVESIVDPELGRSLGELRMVRSVESVDDDFCGPTHVGGKDLHVTEELRGDKAQVIHCESQLGYLSLATGISGDEAPLAERRHQRVVGQNVQPGFGHCGGDTPEGGPSKVGTRGLCDHHPSRRKVTGGQAVALDRVQFAQRFVPRVRKVEDDNAVGLVGALQEGETIFGKDMNFRPTQGVVVEAGQPQVSPRQIRDGRVQIH